VQYRDRKKKKEKKKKKGRGERDYQRTPPGRRKPCYTTTAGSEGEREKEKGPGSRSGP